MSNPNGWVVGIFNSDATTRVSSSFELTMSLQVKSLGYLSVLQMALIGAVAGASSEGARLLLRYVTRT